jgi:hypothetical protein
MSLRSVIFLTLALSTAFFAADSSEEKLAVVDKAPSGVSPQITATLDPHGMAVNSPAGTVCEIWLGKSLAAKAGFKPTLSVKYPFQPGQLIGVLRVGDKTEFTDFRGQPVKPGIYTLRYGQQPQDGNHIGTSETLDFLLAIPAASDSDPKPLGPTETLQKDSAKAAGTNHPAIFSLLPAESAVTSPSLAKDDNNHWVLSTPAQTEANGQRKSLSLRLIVIGKAEG